MSTRFQKLADLPLQHSAFLCLQSWHTNPPFHEDGILALPSIRHETRTTRSAAYHGASLASPFAPAARHNHYTDCSRSTLDHQFFAPRRLPLIITFRA
jgi:hypothetical protein